jgi:hypothetical protein
MSNPKDRSDNDNSLAGEDDDAHFSVPGPNEIQKLLRSLPARTKNLPKEYIQWLKKVSAKVGPERRADLERVFMPMIQQVAKEMPKDATMETAWRRLFELQREATSASRALSAPVPILRYKGASDEPDSHGLGIFIEISDQFILLTAAHVLDGGDDSDLRAGVNKSFVSLDGMWYRTRLPFSGNREHDKVDIGYCILEDDETLSELQSSDRVLNRSDVILNEPLPGLSLRTCGYPVSRIKFGDDHSVITDLTSVEGDEITPEDYEELGLDPKINIAMRYNRKRMFSPRLARTMTPVQKLEGMSGGGIFVEAFDDQPPFVKFKLVGITTNHSKVNPSIIYGTRLTEFVKGIHATCPELFG